MLTGLFVRYFMVENINYLLIGNFIAGIGNAYVVNAEMLFFKNWFHTKNIKYYFPLVAMSIFMGAGFGSFLPH